jgi:hypothetical protein
MRKGAHKELMTTILDDLLNDSRLVRLFSTDARHCALQLWVLQIKSEQSLENRIVYGRLIPYSYSDNRWSASDDDNFHFFGQIEAQVIRLNLYVESVHCAEILRQLSASRTISAISQELRLGLSNQMKARFGTTALAADELVYRPVAYFLNRDAHDRRSLSSPHGGAGALSASIIQTDKGSLFRLGQDYDVALTKTVVRHLNAETGLDFGGADIARFGDLELMVFPALDDSERCLLSVSWADSPRALVARFNPMQVSHFSGFLFRLNIENSGYIVYSGFAIAERDEKDEFELSDQLGTTTDSAEVEIFGFNGDHSREGTLCCRWRIGYIRQISLQTNLVGHGAGTVKFDWLEKTTRPSSSARVKAVLTIGRGSTGSASLIGGRGADPWAPANRDLTSLFARLHPPKSEGRFFRRWGPSNGEGRLQFVEWFKKLLDEYQQHQVVIFDPYFETAGLGLMLLGAAPNADYIVFTSLPKTVNKDEVTPSESDDPTPGRIDNLVASCGHNRRQLQCIKLRIYGLKHGRLHDRYILVMAPDQLPVAGFHLSNSLQSAAENYPLLVTPIPADVLLEVEQYKFGLVREAWAAQAEGETESPTIQLLFDSKASPTTPRHFEPLLFLDRVQAGDVLSVWTDEPSLRGLSGDPLKERMAALGLLNGNTLDLPEKPGLRNCVGQRTDSFADFTATWEVLGDVLAHSRTEDHDLCQLESERGFLQFLAQFLEASFKRAHEETGKELRVIDARLFREPVEILLRSPNHLHHFFHGLKHAALTWPEYYTIKSLWWYAPDALVLIAEAQMANVPIEPGDPDTVRLSLLSQIVGEISFSIQFEISDTQRERLIHSSNGLLRWMGLNAIERQLEKPEGFASILRSIAAFSHHERVRTLGWMVQRAAGNPKSVEIYSGLIEALHGALSTTIPADELKHLVDSMRGHMRQLSWAEPWLFCDVISPLLQNGRANTDDASEIWIRELAALLEPEHRSRLFEHAREGRTTNVAAYLFAYSSTEGQQASLKSLTAILKRQRRILQQPLASTSNWTRWDDALAVSMWILAFTRWSQYYLRERDMTNLALENLSQSARKLAMVRSMDEWRSKGVGEQGELAAFLDQMEELLAVNDESKIEDQ